MQVINIRKKELQKLGYQDLEDWLKKPNHIYIGRNMSFYVKGADKSKWFNPYPVKKYGLKKCLELFREYLIHNTDLYNQLEELDGKILGCWCEKNKCHGDILIELLINKKLAKRIDDTIN